MRRGAVIAILLVVAAAFAGALGYRSGCDTQLRAAARQGDVSAWLRREFHLTGSQSAAIEKLHRDYSAVCEEHCRAIRESKRERDALRAVHPSDTAALSAAERRLAERSAECESSLLRHLDAVAWEMAPEDGRRYLELMRPRVAAYGHAGAPGLDLESPQPEHAH